MRKYLILITILALSSANKHKLDRHDKHKKSYVCPPNFMRLSNKCYYFSNKTEVWQNAYWKCRDMHSNIATIKNSNQDNILRRTLDHDGLVPLERWIGGRYDWGTMSWQWAASGKPFQYQGFGSDEEFQNKESLNWHCIVLDPRKHYKWSPRKCTDEKHYICQTKLRVVGAKDRKKLQKHYKNNLNEVPVPEITSNNISNDTFYKGYKLQNPSAFAMRPEQKIKRKNKKDTLPHKSIYNTTSELRDEKLKHKELRKRRNKHKNNKNKYHNMERIKWKTYYQSNRNPLHPRVAVEEFS